MIDIGIVGGSGYTGAELLRLLLRHPQVRVRALTSRQESGRRADEVFPSLRGFTDLRFSPPDALDGCAAVFFATPHGVAMQTAPALVKKGVKVLDLSADFRLKDVAQFKQWYQHDHAAPELLNQAVYGLPEVNRAALKTAPLVAVPGCYPTSVQLGLLPLLENGAIKTDSVIADCKSGVSGAGRELKLGSLYSEAAESFKAYGAGGHRHQPEIEQGLAAIAGRDVGLTFVPHLVPMNRGIHATLYATLIKTGLDVQALYEARYANEPFVRVLPAGSHPETRHVRGSNICQIAVHVRGDRVIVLSTIDNLVKGAAGQAVQCFNLRFGLAETAGLDTPSLWP